MNDAEFLDYCETHAQSERAGFVREHVERLYRLAGVEIPPRIAADLRDGEIYGWPGAGEFVQKARVRLATLAPAASTGPFRSPLDTLQPEDAARWRKIEAVCRAWHRTRERPHPPMPEVVQYVVKAGEPIWTGEGMARVKEATSLDWPPTQRGAEWNSLYSRRERGGSVAYYVVPVDRELYQHLDGLGLLVWPAGETIDNRKAPDA